MKNHGKYTFLFAFFIIIFLSSCAIFKKNNNKKTSKLSETITIQPVIDTLKNNYLEFNTFQTVFSGKFIQNGKSMPLRGIVKIKKDSLILLSIRPALGIELYKILFESDSIKILNKIKKEYIITDYKYLEKKFAIDLDFKKIQSILINQFFAYPTRNTIINYKLEYLKNDNIIEITSKSNFKGNMINHELKISQNNFFLISNKVSQIRNNKSINILYSDFNNIKNAKFPKIIEIKLSENSIKSYIYISYKNINLNKTLNFNFAYFNNYKIIKID